MRVFNALLTLFQHFKVFNSNSWKITESNEVKENNFKIYQLYVTRNDEEKNVGVIYYMKLGNHKKTKLTLAFMEIISNGQSIVNFKFDYIVKRIKASHWLKRVFELWSSASLEIYFETFWLLNPFLPSVPFWSPWKTLVFWCFQGDQKGTLGRNGLK